MQKIGNSLPEEEQPVEMVDRREDHLAETAARREKQPAGMASRQGQGEPRPVDIPERTPHFFKIILSPHASKLVSSASGFMMRHFHLISLSSVSTKEKKYPALGMKNGSFSSANLTDKC